MDEEPGPPLKTNVSGRAAASSTPVRVYATEKMLARGSPSSLRSVVVLATAR